MVTSCTSERLRSMLLQLPETAFQASSIMSLPIRDMQCGNRSEPTVNTTSTLDMDALRELVNDGAQRQQALVDHDALLGAQSLRARLAQPLTARQDADALSMTTPTAPPTGGVISLMLRARL